MAVAAAVTHATNRADRPHMVALLADDLGYYDTAVHNPRSPTPTLAALAADGLLLERHYVFRFCSPSRRSFLTGRLPTSITTVQPDGGKFCSDFTPLATRLLSEKLAAVGYRCHFVGKGHLGYQTMDHLPIQRGFASHVGYLSGSEGYSHGGGAANPTLGTHDLWRDLAPATSDVPTMVYSADFYSREAVKIIEDHGQRADRDAAPLFMYLAIQNVHSPYSLPPAWQTHSYPQMGSKWHVYANMLAMLDGAVSNVTGALRRTGLWTQTLLLFTADNGGIGEYGNNYPLRGHKHDPWEGGTRALAFLAGGALPTHLSGTNTSALVHIADWYPTFATLAGADPSDDAHIGGGVHPIDGVDVWPMLTRRNDTQPRPCTVVTEVSAIEVEQQVEQPPQYPQDSSHKQQVEPRPQYPQDGSHVDDDDQGSDRTIPDQKRSGRTTPALLWKLVTLAGQSNYYDETGGQVNGTGLPCLLSRQPDPPQPGRTDPIVNGPASHERHACPVCNETLPCLFELVSDPQERHNRAAEPAMAGLVERLRRAIDAANANSYVNGSLDAALLSSRYEPINTTQQWGGFLGPCYRRKG